MSRTPQCGYDAVAETYDRRYAVNPLAGVERALRAAARRHRARRALEVGCGSGHWLARLADTVPLRVGADLSLGMLWAARRADPAAYRVRCRAERPPFAASGFDLVYSINALHHFDDQEGCLRLAAEGLRPGGLLLLVGLDPHRADHHWYLYEFFPGTLEADLERYPSSRQLIGWMRSAGLRSIASREVEKIARHFRGREVLEDYFLDRSAASQWMKLSAEAHTSGLARLRRAVERAGREGREAVFGVEMTLVMVTGRRRRGARGALR